MVAVLLQVVIYTSVASHVLFGPGSNSTMMTPTLVVCEMLGCSKQRYHLCVQVMMKAQQCLTALGVKTACS